MLDHATQRVRANRRVEASAEAVRAVIMDQPGHARWLPGLRSVERLAAPAGHPVAWQWTFRRSTIRIELIDLTHAPHAPIEWRCADPTGRTEWHWRFEFMRESGDACTVSIEERRCPPGLWNSLMLLARRRGRPDVHRYLDAFVSAFGAVRGG